MVVLVVLVAAGDDPTSTDAAAQAARAALSPASSVIVHRAAPSDDASALDYERAAGADAVVVLTSSRSVGTRVRLRIHRRASDAWHEREFVFEGADNPGERGRTLGFALASMFPEPGPSPAAAAAEPASALPAVPEATPNERVAPAAPVSPPALRASIDAAVIAGVGLDGPAGGVGGRVGGGWLVAPRTAVRIDASARREEVPSAQSTSLLITAGPGFVFDLVPSGPGRAFGAAARGSAIAIVHIHRRVGDGPTPVSKSRWLPGVAAVLEGSLRLSESTSLLAAAGLEAAFGYTDLVVNGRKVATIPPLRAIGDLGLRIRF